MSPIRFQHEIPRLSGDVLRRRYARRSDRFRCLIRAFGILRRLDLASRGERTEQKKGERGLKPPMLTLVFHEYPN